MEQVLEIVFFGNGQIERDIRDRFVPQYSHKVQRIKMLIPNEVFSGAKFQVKIGAKNAYNEELISGFATVSEDKADKYNVFDFLLTEYYTQTAGSIYFSVHVLEFSADEQEYVDIFTSVSFNLVIQKGSKHIDYTIQDPNALSILDAKINDEVRRRQALDDLVLTLSGFNSSSFEDLLDFKSRVESDYYSNSGDCYRNIDRLEGLNGLHVLIKSGILKDRINYLMSNIPSLVETAQNHLPGYTIAGLGKALYSLKDDNINMRAFFMLYIDSSSGPQCMFGLGDYRILSDGEESLNSPLFGAYIIDGSLVLMHQPNFTGDGALTLVPQNSDGNYEVYWPGWDIDNYGADYVGGYNDDGTKFSFYNEKKVYDSFWDFLQIKYPAGLVRKAYLKEEVNDLFQKKADAVRIRTVEEEPGDWQTNEYLFKEEK